MKLKHAYCIVFGIILLDQITKIYIKTHFLLDTGVDFTTWCKIRFIENEGMAWGIAIPGIYGKLFLTVFRLVAVVGIGYWLWDSIKKGASNYLIVALSMILAGAFGNIIDSVFYGVIFDDSTHVVATLFADKPYGTLLYGKVVDMFYFPFYEGILPQWLPIWGGTNFKFFNAIFNVADFAISSGVGVLLVFNKRTFVTLD